MGDVGERPAVHQNGRVFERLHEIWLDGIPQKGGHGAGYAQVIRINRRIVIFVGDKDATEPFFEIRQIIRKAEDCHDFACHGDLEAVLPRHTVYFATQAYDAMPQRAIVHIHAALKNDAARVDAE